MKNVVGTTIKVSGLKSQVELIKDRLVEDFPVVHVTQIIGHRSDDSVHVYINLGEVKCE